MVGSDKDWLLSSVCRPGRCRGHGWSGIDLDLGTRYLHGHVDWLSDHLRHSRLRYTARAFRNVPLYLSEDLANLSSAQAVVAVQNALPPKQSQLGVSFLVFCQTFSAAVFVVVANTIFTQSLISEARRLVPSIDPTEILRAGGSAEAIRSLAPPGSPELAALLKVFSRSFDSVCYLMIALAGISTAAAFGMGWIDTRQTKTHAKPETAAEA